MDNVIDKDWLDAQYSIPVPVTLTANQTHITAEMANTMRARAKEEADKELWRFWSRVANQKQHWYTGITKETD